jgi:large subunit ribosomal protein L4e
MKLKVYDVSGKPVDEIQIPESIAGEIREDIIRRAVLSEESREYQPKGAYRWAGLQTSAQYRGRKEAYASLKNRGQAMLPREFYGGGTPGRVRRIPSSVKGRRAHPPKPEKIIIEEINKKEFAKAMRSAISASLSVKAVKARGHIIGDKYPAVLADSFESIKKTREMLDVLNVFMKEDIERSQRGKRIRSGIRSRRAKQKLYPKSALIIASEGSAALKAGRNIPGVETTTPKALKVKNLAPGAKPGRPIVISAKALKELAAIWGEKK